MKDSYENKMVKGYKAKDKKIAKYIGEYDIWIPSLKLKVRPGDTVPGFPIDEAVKRNDFILVKEY